MSSVFNNYGLEPDFKSANLFFCLVVEQEPQEESCDSFRCDSNLVKSGGDLWGRWTHGVCMWT